MILARAAVPGPRTVALHRAAPIVACLVLALATAACGTTGPSGSKPLLSQAPPAGSTAPGASPERWPGTTVLAVIALGAADGEIQKAGDDLQKAADEKDLEAMRGAADGLARMIEAIMPNVDRLDAYAGTKSVAALYRQAFPEIAAGARQLRDAVAARDGAGITAGYLRIVKGNDLYAPIREQIAALVEQAIVQQRLYLK